MISVTKTVAELLSLIIDEMYGELPSRIFSMLLKRGRSTAHDLEQALEMNKSKLRHGLAVLQQYNLLYWHVNAGAQHAFYEANVENAYNLIRAGKILEMIGASYGGPAKDVMQNLLLSGQTRIGDLVAAYQEKIELDNKAKEAAEDPSSYKSPLPVKDTSTLNSVICRLVEADLVDLVHHNSFEPPDDIVERAKKEVTDKHFPTGIRGTKAKIEFDEKLSERLREFRSESKALKRKLEQNGSAAKRRKLAGGVGLLDAEMDPALDLNQVIRINYEKCMVDLRNRRLVQYAADIFSDTTSYVYAEVLKHLTKDISRCRLDPLVDRYKEDDKPAQLTVTTAEILDRVKTSLDLSLGLGKITREKLSRRAAETICPYPPTKNVIIGEAEVQGDASSDEEGPEQSTDDEDFDSDYKPNGINGVNGQAKVDKSKPIVFSRPDQLRQHLLLLAESNQKFVRQCAKDEWTVDFELVMDAMRESEIDLAIENTAGQRGLRLVRILRANGKLDEKALPQVALLPKNEIQRTMHAMHEAGFLNIQEIPREAKADVKKSFFLWYTDLNRAQQNIINKSYKTMSHCLQVLETLRHKEDEVLAHTKRSDVKGHEEEMLKAEFFQRYKRFLQCEKMLLSQVMRVDDLVAVLRDF
ncbi:RNA polymerase III subunit RPC82-domain-containing protein [Podospora fimiseda]|uniref:DNA-directed RNA polymerase III subunit RPC3 n=1 Tax=Podospora fimiseda TaxID=252190 RepID=A0AAN7GZB5_9PEZI|nr:RNA polymerase III subunit RPC82-domain-containing protein [Podospora fimiseda]